jgi:site-specific recombinase XerD
MKKVGNIYLEKFKEWLVIKGFTSETVKGLLKTVNYFINWIEEENIELETVTYNDVVAYINYKRKQGNKPRTLIINTNALNHLFNFLIVEYGFNENPASNVKIQGIKRKVLQEILTPVELENIYKSYSVVINKEENKKIPPQKNNELARKRNKIILGLLVYQGIKTEEIGKLEIQDLQLREGKITIQGGIKTNARTIKLEPHQIFDIYDYVNEVRKEILQITNKTSNKVFISVGTSLNYNNILQKLVKSIKAVNPKIKDLKQIRTSVITNWLKVYNLRKTQYLAGHRYVSSTEAYQVNNIDELHENITKYHPLN